MFLYVPNTATILTKFNKYSNNHIIDAKHCGFTLTYTDLISVGCQLFIHSLILILYLLAQSLSRDFGRKAGTYPGRAPMYILIFLVAVKATSDLS